MFVTLCFHLQVVWKCNIFFAAYGDLRIRDGSDSGLLEMDISGDWYAVCINAFNDEAEDVACRQLGFVRSSDVYVYSRYLYYNIATTYTSSCRLNIIMYVKYFLCIIRNRICLRSQCFNFKCMQWYFILIAASMCGLFIM